MWDHGVDIGMSYSRSNKFAEDPADYSFRRHWIDLN